MSGNASQTLNCVFPNSRNAAVLPDIFSIAPDSRETITIAEYGLADGVLGTLQSLEGMAQAVRGEIEPDYSGYRDPFNVRAAWEIRRGQKTNLRSEESLAALFRFVRDSICYLDHPPNKQRVQDCKRTLLIGTGDCVSKSVCLSTLAAACGIKTRFVSQCLNGKDFVHVYVEAWEPRTRAIIALDPTADGQEGRAFGEMGWRQSIPDGGFETPYDIFT